MRLYRRMMARKVARCQHAISPQSSVLREGLRRVMRTTKFRTDNELIVATRAGDPDAYGQLWKPHYCAAKHAAISATSTFDPDDLAQEAFAAVYLSILKNGGPTTAFRAYLLATVRNTA